MNNHHQIIKSLVDFGLLLTLLNCSSDDANDKESIPLFTEADLSTIQRSDFNVLQFSRTFGG